MLEIYGQLMTGSKHNNQHFVLNFMEFYVLNFVWSFYIKSRYPLRDRGSILSVKFILNFPNTNIAILS